jgi:hypothetical protein
VKLLNRMGCEEVVRFDNSSEAGWFVVEGEKR